MKMNSIFFIILIRVFRFGPGFCPSLVRYFTAILLSLLFCYYNKKTKKQNEESFFNLVCNL